MPEMTGNRFFAETLKGYGVTTIFWMPAVLKPALMEIERVGGIKRVLAHSEKSAAYMADGYARASRRPGIVMCQSVGAANLAAGLQDAWLAHSPVIAITGRQLTSVRYRNAYQEIDHWPMFEPVTKYNVYVDTLEQFPFELRQAFREATTGAPGPVHLELPGIQGEVVGSAQADLDVIVEDTFGQYPAFRLEPDGERVRQAAGRLGRAERPVIVAGGGAVASQAGPEIVELAERLSAPIAISLNGKGAIPDTHPLVVGAVGTYPRWCANRVVSEADLVLFVGSQTGDQPTDHWTIPQQDVETIQIDLDAVELGRNYPNSVALLGDAKVTVSRLIEALGDVAPKPEWTERARLHLAHWREEFEPQMNSDASPIRPERLCRELTKFLPDDAFVVADTGHSATWSATMIELRAPTQDYVRCAGSLGWSLPASLGVKCAVPERPVICFTGDGGIWYHLSELETAARCGINTVTVINNNRSLNQDKPGIDVAYRGVPEGNPEELWVFQDIDFAAVARLMGCFGIRVERAADIASALEQALAAGKPAVVDVRSDIDAFAPWTRSPS